MVRLFIYRDFDLLLKGVTKCRQTFGGQRIQPGFKPVSAIIHNSKRMNAACRWRRHPERIVSFYPRLYGAEGDQPPVTRKEKEAVSRCALPDFTLKSTPSAGHVDVPETRVRASRTVGGLPCLARLCKEIMYYV